MKTHLIATVLAIVGVLPVVAHAEVFASGQLANGQSVYLTDTLCKVPSDSHYVLFVNSDGSDNGTGCYIESKDGERILAMKATGEFLTWPISGFKATK